MAPTETTIVLQASTEDYDLGLVEVPSDPTYRNRALIELAHEHQTTVHFRDPVTDRQVASFDPFRGRCGCLKTFSRG